MAMADNSCKSNRKQNVLQNEEKKITIMRPKNTGKVAEGRRKERPGEERRETKRELHWGKLGRECNREGAGPGPYQACWAGQPRPAGRGLLRGKRSQIS